MFCFNQDHQLQLVDWKEALARGPAFCGKGRSSLSKQRCMKIQVSGLSNVSQSMKCIAGVGISWYAHADLLRARSAAYDLPFDHSGCTAQTPGFDHAWSVEGRCMQSQWHDLGQHEGLAEPKDVQAWPCH